MSGEYESEVDPQAIRAAKGASAAAKRARRPHTTAATRRTAPTRSIAFPTPNNSSTTLGCKHGRDENFQTPATLLSTLLPTIYLRLWNPLLLRIAMYSQQTPSVEPLHTKLNIRSPIAPPHSHNSNVDTSVDPSSRGSKLPWIQASFELDDDAPATELTLTKILAPPASVSQYSLSTQDNAHPPTSCRGGPFDCSAAGARG